MLPSLLSLLAKRSMDKSNLNYTACCSYIIRNLVYFKLANGRQSLLIINRLLKNVTLSLVGIIQVLLLFTLFFSMVYVILSLPNSLGSAFKICSTSSSLSPNNITLPISTSSLCFYYFISTLPLGSLEFLSSREDPF